MPAPAPKYSKPTEHAVATPKLRSRALRPAVTTDASQPSGALGLQDRLAKAFAAPAGRQFEGMLMRLIIVAATCLVLRTAIIGGAGALGLLR